MPFQKSRNHQTIALLQSPTLLSLVAQFVFRIQQSTNMKFIGAIIAFAFVAGASAAVSSPSRAVFGRSSPPRQNLSADGKPFKKCTIGVTSTDPNCCWGGQEGSDACHRQQGTPRCGNGMEAHNFCKNMGIPNSKCVSCSHSLSFFCSYFAMLIIALFLCRMRIVAIRGLGGASHVPREGILARTLITVLIEWIL